MFGVYPFTSSLDDINIKEVNRKELKKIIVNENC